MQTITQLDSQPGIFGVNTHPDPCDDVNEVDDDNDMEFKDSRLPQWIIRAVHSDVP